MVLRTVDLGPRGTYFFQQCRNKVAFGLFYSQGIYHICDRSIAAQLISRHWIITDANGKIQEVDGDGVVGEQPYLSPGEEFSYSSGAILETPVGSMHGIYRMIADDGITFDAPVAPFTLAVPRILN